jgi:hypothetical protein
VIAGAPESSPAGAGARSDALKRTSPQLPSGEVLDLPLAGAATPIFMNAPIPFGFRLADDGRQLELDESELQIQRISSHLSARGMSVIAIARELTARGFVTRSGRPWRGVAMLALIARLEGAAPTSRAIAPVPDATCFPTADATHAR